MKMRGGDIVVRALEDEGVTLTFGIPGTHNIELYDALERSTKIRPILVTDEQSASFMADAVSRTSETIGVANVVPGAGVTHTLSGVGEAYMDNVPLLVLTCGIRLDTGRAYQLHDIDQLAILRPVTKAALRPERSEDIYATVRRAIRLARAGTPGPVAVEIPANLYLLSQDPGPLSFDEPVQTGPTGEEQVDAVAKALDGARRVVIYAGAGAARAGDRLRSLAEKLQAPVATTIQGKGVLSERHPLWLWCGLGRSAPAFVSEVTDPCDVMLAIGCRFGEVATASYGLTPPETLIHVDIAPEVLGRNYPATIAVEADADRFLTALLPHVRERAADTELVAAIARGHAIVRAEAERDASPTGVTPALLFRALQKHARPATIYATDSGNGTFLAMEHLRLEQMGCFIAPVDYSCMGYGVPAAIGAKFANPDRDVVALVGDGALLMTGLELLTASSYNVAPLVFVLRDGELGQIAQFQRTALNRDTCSILPEYSVEDLATLTRCEFVTIKSDGALDAAISKAFDIARTGKPLLVDVAIDYTRKTYFTKGVVATNFWRLPMGERLRMIGRAAARRITGIVIGTPAHRK